MSGAERLIDFRELVPMEYNKTMELVRVCAIEVLCKNVSKVIELTSHIRNQQLRDFMHIKLCKRLSDTTIAVVYGTTTLSQEDTEALKNEGVEIFSHLSPEVSKNPPMSKKQLLEWSVSWPLNFHKPAWEPKKFSKAEKLKVIDLLNRAMEVGLNNGDKAAGCIITYNGTIVAEGWDRRNSCVLDHSVIVAIRSISERIADFGKNGELPEYLCVGCDVYLSNEPCAMCAMALIHSRVSNVYYAKSDTANGALGSNHSIHHLKALNHCYRAFEGRFS